MTDQWNQPPSFARDFFALRDTALARAEAMLARARVSYDKPSDTIMIFFTAADTELNFAMYYEARAEKLLEEGIDTANDPTGHQDPNPKTRPPTRREDLQK